MSTVTARSARTGGLGLLYAGWFLVDVDLVVINPLLVPLAGSFGVGLGTAALALTAYLLLFGIMQSVHGTLSDAVGRVKVLRIGLAGLGAANLLTAFAPTVELLIAGRAVAGAFAAALVPVTVAYVGDRIPPERRMRALSGLLSVSALGAAAGTVGAGALTALLSWRAALVLVAVAGLTLAVLYRRLPEVHVRAADLPPVSRRLAEVLRNRWLVFLLVFALAEGAAMVGFFNFFGPALQVGGSGVLVAGVVTGTYGLGAVLAGRLTGPLRLPAPVMFALGTGLLLAGYVIAALTQSVAGILAASVLAGAALAVGQSALQAWTIELSPPALRGTTTALAASAVFVGAALGTATVGGLAAAGEFGALFGVAALVTAPVLVVGTLALARYARTRTHT